MSLWICSSQGTPSATTVSARTLLHVAERRPELSARRLQPVPEQVLPDHPHIPEQVCHHPPRPVSYSCRPVPGANRRQSLSGKGLRRSARYNPNAGTAAAAVLTQFSQTARTHEYQCG